MGIHFRMLKSLQVVLLLLIFANFSLGAGLKLEIQLKPVKGEPITEPVKAGATSTPTPATTASATQDQGEGSGGSVNEEEANVVNATQNQGQEQPGKTLSMAFRSFGGEDKAECDYKCEGNQRCKHITKTSTSNGGTRTAMGGCVGIKCVSVTEECGPCFKKCKDISQDIHCDYDCHFGDNMCKHTFTYPTGRSGYGTCWRTNCKGETAECETCAQNCPNIN